MPTFTRKIENFICKNCKTPVIGDGYTNHCPNCLWSRHVDITPGDRQELCKGMMKPIELEIKGQDKFVVHRCEQCGKIRKCKISDNDNFEAILKVSSR